VLTTMEEIGRALQLFTAGSGRIALARTTWPRHLFGGAVLEHEASAVRDPAILAYLDRVLPNPPLTPAVRGARAVDQVIDVNAGTVPGRPPTSSVSRVVGARGRALRPMRPPIEAALPKARAVFDELARLLGAIRLHRRNDDARGLLVAPHLGLFSLAPEWPALVAPTQESRRLAARIDARPSLQAPTGERVSDDGQAA